jgi:hypothetical protein
MRVLSVRSDGKEALALKYPAKVGDVYGYPVLVIGNPFIVIIDDLMMCTVKCTDTTIFVPAGQFRCYMYQTSIPSSGSKSYTQMFLSPSYGWIKRDDCYSTTANGSVYLTRSRRAESILVH